MRLGRRVLRLDRLDRRGPRRRRDGRRPIHAPPRGGDVRAAPLGRGSKTNGQVYGVDPCLGASRRYGPDSVDQGNEKQRKTVARA